MKSKVKSKSKPKKGTEIWLIVAAIAVVVVVVFAALSSAGEKTAVAQNQLPAEVTPADVYQAWQNGAFVLDVREPDEWNAGHIPGATLIPLGQLSARASEVPQDQPIYVVCRSGNRSATGRDILLDAGFSSVTSMAGGMNQWAASGYPVVTGP